MKIQKLCELRATKRLMAWKEKRMYRRKVEAQSRRTVRMGDEGSIVVFPESTMWSMSLMMSKQCSSIDNEPMR